MLIAMDYDRTYTADPDGWDVFVALMKSRGHEFICVTRRTEMPALDRERQIPMPMIFAGDVFKRVAAERHGYHVDVWIDDEPGTVEPARILEFED